MRKILLIVTLSLGAFAMAQTAGKIGDTQSANNDWYSQRLSAAVQMYSSVEATAAPSVGSPIGSQSATQPESMAANTGSQEDWYNQKLAAAVQHFSRGKAAATAPSTSFQ